MSYIIRKTFSIAMGHILEDAYTKKCCQLHGHTYTIELELYGEDLNEDNMIADYTYVKDIFNKTIKDVYDHATIIPPKWHGKFKNIPGVIEVHFNPTAEAIAQYFYDLLVYALSTMEYYLSAVVVKETDTNYACYRPEPGSRRS